MELNKRAMAATGSIRYGLTVLGAIVLIAMFLFPGAGAFALPSPDGSLPQGDVSPVARGSHGTLANTSPDTGNWVVAQFDVWFVPTIVHLSMFGENWTAVDLGSGNFPAPAGSPRVPVKVITLRVPGDMEVMSVRYQGLSSMNVRLPPVAPLSDPYDPTPYTVDEGSYLEQGTIPPLNMSYVRVRVGDEYEAGFRYWDHSIMLFPVRYSPAAGEALLYSQAHVTYRYDPTPEPIQVPVGGPVKEVLPDYSGIAAYGGSGGRAGTGLAPRYIIITTLGFVDSLQGLADWKTQKGYPCEIYSKESIDASYSFNDTQENIKFFIRDKFNEGSGVLKYVLLFGDSGQVPPRECYDGNADVGVDDGQIPADSYYACIGDNWDADSDHIYGEVGDIQDFIPDIYLGRIPVSDQSKIATWVTQLKSHETELSPENWQSKAILIGGATHDSSPTYPGDGKYQSQRLKSLYLDDVFDIFSEYYDNADGTTNLYEYNVKPAMNSGASFVMYTDHGNEDYWPAIRPQGSFSSSDAAGLTNGNKQFLAYGMACLTSRFDGQECIGEAFVENTNGGAFAYISHVRTATAAVGYNFYSPGASGLEEDFCRMLKYDNFNMPHAYLHAGGAHSSAKKYFAQQNAAYMSQAGTLTNWLENTLFGDPDAHLMSAPASSFIVKNTTTTVYNIEIDMVVTDAVDSSPVGDALVCIRNQQNGVYATGYTDGNGKIHFSVPRITGNVNIDTVVSKPNFKTYISSFPALDEIAPVTSLNLDPPVPDGENGYFITAPTVNFTVDEPAVTEYRFGTVGDWIEYGGNFTVDSGDEPIYFWSVDSASNVEEAQSYNIAVDTVSPVTSIVSDPPEANGKNGCFIGVRPVISLWITDDNSSDVLTYYRWDSGNGKVYTGPISNAPDGIHKLYVHSTDLAGHVEAEKYVSFYIDCSPPVSLLQLEPLINEGNDGWYLTPVTITLVSESDAAIYYYWDSDSKNEVYSSPFTTSEGIHTLHYWAEDAAGNLEAEKTVTLKVDTHVPETEIVLDPITPTGVNGWYIYPATITFSVPGENNATTYYSWDNDLSHATEYLPDDEIPVPEGESTLHFYTVDEAGNQENVKERIVKYDNVPPVTTISSLSEITDGWYRTSPAFNLNVNEPAATIYYRWKSDTADRRYDRPFQPPSPEGRYTLYYWSVDPAGNKEIVRGMDVDVDTVAPGANLTVSSGSSVSTPYTFDASGSHDGNAIVSYYFDFGDGKNSGWVSTPVVAHNYSSSGSYHVKVKVRDVSGQESDWSGKDISVGMDLLAGGPGSTGIIIGAIILLALVMVSAVVILLVVLRRKGKARSGPAPSPVPESSSGTVPRPPDARVQALPSGQVQASPGERRPPPEPSG